MQDSPVGLSQRAIVLVTLGKGYLCTLAQSYIMSVGVLLSGVDKTVFEVKRKQSSRLLKDSMKDRVRSLKLLTESYIQPKFCTFT